MIEVAGQRDHARSALSYRTFRLYWSGAFLSGIGSWLQVAAVLWFARSVGSNTLVGVVNLAAWVPTLLLGLAAGVMADRVDRRRMMLVAQAAMMVSSVLIGLSIDLEGIHDLTLIVFVAISGIANTFFLMAWIASTPLLVPRDALLSAITLNSVRSGIARLAGPVLGGWLLLVADEELAFYVNALTFGAFMVLILVGDAPIPAPRHDDAPVGSAMLRGFAYVRANPWIVRVLVAIGGLSFFGNSFIVLVPAVSMEILGVSEHAYGLLMGASGLGALVGMVAVSSLKRKIRPEAMIGAGALLCAAALVGLSLSRHYWLSCLLAAGIGGSFVLANAAAGAAIQGSVPPEMEGRVSSMWTVAFLGVFPIGGLLLGVLSDRLSPETALVIAGLGCVAVTGFVTGWVRVPGGGPRPADAAAFDRDDIAHA